MANGEPVCVVIPCDGHCQALDGRGSFFGVKRGGEAGGGGKREDLAGIIRTPPQCLLIGFGAEKRRPVEEGIILALQRLHPTTAPQVIGDSAAQILKCKEWGLPIDNIHGKPNGEEHYNAKE